MRRALVTLATALALAGCSSASDDTAEQAEVEAEVASVIDGDTIETAAGDRVRLVQIDAPEVDENECYAAQAAAALRALLPPGTSIRLEADPRLDAVDRFDRLLRYVHRGETNVNLELVRQGAASVWFFEGDQGRYADDLLDAARAARDADRGLWGVCPAAKLDPQHGVESR
jgi:micrococcal nuclease